MSSHVQIHVFIIPMKKDLQASKSVKHILEMKSLSLLKLVSFLLKENEIKLKLSKSV